MKIKRFEKGQRVRITKGGCKNFEGVITQVWKKEGRYLEYSVKLNPSFIGVFSHGQIEVI